ncbi:MAG: hypothetical protein IT286_04820 [Proteobacteria bacterium]|nr:hypothetical protein [Pseudomonadota bacterium]
MPLMFSSCPEPNKEFFESSRNDGSFDSEVEAIYNNDDLVGVLLPGKEYSDVFNDSNLDDDALTFDGIVGSRKILMQDQFQAWKDEKGTPLPDNLTVTYVGALKNGFGAPVKFYVRVGGKAVSHTTSDDFNLLIEFKKPVCIVYGEQASFTKCKDPLPIVLTIPVNFENATPTVEIPVLHYQATEFTEANENDGTITQTIDVIAEKGKFSQSDGTFTQDADYELDNLPTGLTAEIEVISATKVRLSLTGTAAAHTVADSVDGIGLKFLKPAFEKGILPEDGTEEEHFDITFKDPYTVEQSALGLHESGLNNGAVPGSIRFTSNSDFALTGGTYTLNTHYTLTGSPVPAGLTAVLTAGDAETATLMFTGSAMSHADMNSVIGIAVTFLPAAFANNVAPTDGTETADVGISFYTNTILIYSTPVADGDFGGRAGADSLCDTEQPGGDTHSNVRAFISVDASDEIVDLVTNYSVPTNAPFMSQNGDVVLNDWTDLMDPTNNIALTLAGVVNTTFWWSGSNANGSVAADTCDGWTDNTMMFNGAVALSGDANTWMFDTTSTCDGGFIPGQMSLVCISY